MRYETANAFRTALESRLLARARSDNVPLIRLRKLVAFDRLIARLMVVAPDRWVLKGAVALQFRAGPEYRTTRDIDFGRRDDEAAATFRPACRPVSRPRRLFLLRHRARGTD